MKYKIQIKFFNMVLGAVFLLALNACTQSKAGTKGLSGAVTVVEYPEALPEKDYMEWKNKEPNLVSERVLEEITFTVKYHPAEWMALQSLGPGASAEQLRTETEQYTDLLYFNLRLQLNQAQTELLRYKVNGHAQYSERVKYYSFDVNKDISLVLDDKDTLPCAISHFERAFSITNYTDLLLGFSKKELDRYPGWNKLTVVFHDRIFNQGVIKFLFDKKQLTHTPKITGS